MGQEIWTDVSEGVARMRFNRPESRNALSMAGVAEVIEFLRSLEHDSSIRCLAISGAGTHFMAGGDMRNFTEVLALPLSARARAFEQRALDNSPIWLTLERLRVPSVCAVRGFAVGGALAFAGGADLTIASDTACFILGHAAIGLPPDGGTSYYLPRAVGLKRAKQIAFLADRISAGEAREMGLVNWVVPDAQLEEKTEEIIGRLTRAASLAIGEAKQLLNRALQSDVSTQLTAEAEALARCAASHDLEEGVNAMIARRRPNFSGN
jgi:2-(1,2-epoxy-1,2-dihydrophenyl)acetyl-CoA isomerase